MNADGQPPAAGLAAAFPYATAEAFRTALKDRFAAIAKAGAGYRVDELQRQFAYDRVLARCFTGEDKDRWVLKGAGALLARLAGAARHSKDIDLYYDEQQAAADEAVDALQGALRRDLGDFFRFEVTGVSELQESAKGRRVHLSASLGAKRYADFHVDVVVGTAMSGQPDLVPPLTPLSINGLIRPEYRAFPIADHVADKLLAMVETHAQGGDIHVSSRVKDLVDIALIAATQRLDGSALRAALVTGAAHRRLGLPDRFVVPDPMAWRAGYARQARGSAVTHNFEEAVGLATRLLDPVLAGPVAGIWDSENRAWI